MASLLRAPKRRRVSIIDPEADQLHNEAAAFVEAAEQGKMMRKEYQSQLFALMLSLAFGPSYVDGLGDYWQRQSQIADAVTGGLSWPSLHLTFAFPSLPASPSVVLALSAHATLTIE